MSSVPVSVWNNVRARVDWREREEPGLDQGPDTEVVRCTVREEQRLDQGRAVITRVTGKDGKRDEREQ